MHAKSEITFTKSDRQGTPPTASILTSLPYSEVTREVVNAKVEDKATQEIVTLKEIHIATHNLLFSLPGLKNDTKVKCLFLFVSSVFFLLYNM